MQEMFPLRPGVKATHRLIVCDTFDHEDYTVIVHEGEDVNVIKQRYDGVNMQRIHEIIAIEPPIECKWWTCSHTMGIG